MGNHTFDYFQFDVLESYVDSIIATNPAFYISFFLTSCKIFPNMYILTSALAFYLIILEFSSLSKFSNFFSKILHIFLQFRQFRIRSLYQGDTNAMPILMTRHVGYLKFYSIHQSIFQIFNICHSKSFLDLVIPKSSIYHGRRIGILDCHARHLDSPSTTNETNEIKFYLLFGRWTIIFKILFTEMKF